MSATLLSGNSSGCSNEKSLTEWLPGRWRCCSLQRSCIVLYYFRSLKWNNAEVLKRKKKKKSEVAPDSKNDFIVNFFIQHWCTNVKRKPSSGNAWLRVSSAWFCAVNHWLLDEQIKLCRERALCAMCTSGVTQERLLHHPANSRCQLWGQPTGS